jgi:hypothetical protein
LFYNLITSWGLIRAAQLLDKDPFDRLTVAEAKQHPFFAQMCVLRCAPSSLMPNALCSNWDLLQLRVLLAPRPFAPCGVRRTRDRLFVAPGDAYDFGREDPYPAFTYRSPSFRSARGGGRPSFVASGSHLGIGVSSLRVRGPSPSPTLSHFPTVLKGVIKKIKVLGREKENKEDESDFWELQQEAARAKQAVRDARKQACELLKQEPHGLKEGCDVLKQGHDQDRMTRGAGRGSVERPVLDTRCDVLAVLGNANR